MAGLNLNNMPKTPVKTPNQEMQEIQKLIDRNKAEIMQSIQRMVDEQSLATLKYERNEFKKNLELAQLNITAMDKYLKLAMETVQKETASAIEKISEKVDKLETSSQVITNVINSEGEKLTQKSQNIIKDIGEDAKTSVSKSLQDLERQFQQILSQHQQIATVVRQMYSFEGYSTIGLWVWRWMVIMGVISILKYGVKVESFGTILKMLTGLELIFG